MKKVNVILLSALALIFLVSAMSCGGAKEGKVLVTIGNEKITEGDLDLLGNINPRIKGQLATEFGKKKILDNLVEQELFYKASLKEGLDRDPAVKDKIDIYRKVIISQAYMDKKLQEAAKEYYDKNKNDFEKLNLSHILIRFKNEKNKNDKVTRSEKEALDLANKAKQRIEGGEDFAKVAGEVSEDKMTAKRGGELGMAAKDEARLARRGYGPLLEKAFTMKKGEIVGPIKTEDGYHIILVTSDVTLQPFDQVEQGILFKIRNQERNKLLVDLRKNTKVEYAQSESTAPEKTLNVPMKSEEKPAAVESKKDVDKSNDENDDDEDKGNIEIKKVSDEKKGK